MADLVRVLLVMPQAFDYSPDSNAWQQPIQLGSRFDTILAVPRDVEVPSRLASVCRVRQLGAVRFGENGWQAAYEKAVVALATTLAPGPWVVAAAASQFALEVAHRVGQRMGRPWVWLCWDHPFGARYRTAGPWGRLERGLRTIHLRRRLCQSAGAALFFSPECLESLRLPPWVLNPIGNGVLFHHLQEVAGRIQKQPHLIVMVGYISEDKGGDIVLDAFARVCERNSEARLRLIGAIDPPFRSRYEREAGAPPVRGRVEWCGDLPFDEAMPAAASGVVGLCAYKPLEWLKCNQVLKIGEYQALGIVPVSHDLPGVRSLVRDGIDGMLVPCHSAAHLAKAISRVLEDGELRAELARAACERARSRDWDLMGERLAVFVRAAAARTPF